MSGTATEHRRIAPADGRSPISHTKANAPTVFDTVATTSFEQRRARSVAAARVRVPSGASSVASRRIGSFATRAT